jgi:hypothetical protein
MPRWDDLPERIQGAWISAATAIAKHTIHKQSESLAKTIVDDVLSELDISSPQVEK